MMEPPFLLAVGKIPQVVAQIKSKISDLQRWFPKVGKKIVFVFQSMETPRTMTTPEIIAYLKSKANPANVAGMARYGINAKNTLGVNIPLLRQLARQHRQQHALALELWQSGIHEARILAALVDDPQQVTARQMEAWVRDFDSWDVCDQVCSNLFDKTRFAWQKAVAWSQRRGEFVKRAGFVLMAVLAVHDSRRVTANSGTSFR